MPKLDLSASLEKITAKVTGRLPPGLKKYVSRLTLQQQQTFVLACIGGSGFLVVWIIFSLLFTGNDSYLDQRAFGPQGQNGAPLVNTPTAITKTVQSFPQNKDLPKPKPLPPVEPQIKMADNLTNTQKEQIARLRENVDHQYKSALPFALNEVKMISFALAASRIDKVNMRWDTLIAGASQENLAIEYLSSAQIEIRQLLQNTPGITTTEYDAIYNLSARDAQFNDIANAYKNLVAQGIWGPVNPVTFDATVLQNGDKSDPSLRFPVAPSQPEAPAPNPAANPAAAPAASGTAPAPSR